MARIIREHKRGEVSHETSHKLLYHLTDHHGFAYTLDQNALRSLRHSTISTTYDPRMNGVFGYFHYDFKFVLDGQALVKKYGGFSFDHYIRVGDEGYESLNERELRLNTSEVTDFRNYLVGTVLLMKVFSQKAIQWLLYDNHEGGGLFDAGVTAAPRAIEMLYKHIFEWKKPVWVGYQGRSLTDQELAFIRDAYDLHMAGGGFKAGMRELVAKYPIIDHNKKTLDKTTVIRRQMAEEICDRFNAYFVGRKKKDVRPDEVRNLFRQTIQMLGLGNNAEAVLMAEAERQGMYHPYMAAVDWGIIMRELFDGEIDEALDAMRWIAKHQKRNREWYDQSVATQGEAEHVGTRFG